MHTVTIIGGGAVFPHNDNELAWILFTRKLLAAGTLTSTVAEWPEHRPRIRAAIVAIVASVVFHVLTKRLELKRGHRVCAASVQRMEQDCYDAYIDDVEVVADWVLEHATVPVASPEAWVAPRVNPITVDAHRRWRGERGAQQRPRVPKWLAKELGEDPWRMWLAEAVLTWAGVAAAAGVEVWPIDTWAQERAVVRGEAVPSGPDTRRDVDAVLAAMQNRPAWFVKYVERPLGRKQAPVHTSRPAASGAAPDPLPLELTPLDERDEAALVALAAAVIERILQRVGRGEPAGEVTADVLRRAFTDGGPADGMDSVPGAAPSDAERAHYMIADPAVLERIVHDVLAALHLDR
jgi:hypothetical protein